MRRILIALLLIVTPSATAAQFVPRSPPNEGRQSPTYGPMVQSRSSSVGRDLADVRARIDDGRDTGTLSRRQGRLFRRDAGQVGTLADRYGQDGLSQSEHAELTTRTTVLREQVDLQRLRGAGAAR